MKKQIVLSLALLTISASLVHAQTSQWELEVHGGALRHDVFDESDTDFTIGGRLARYTAAGWGFGGALDYIDAGEQTLDADPIDVRMLHYAAEIDKSFPSSGRTRVTLGAGVGGATASYDGVALADESETQLMIPLSARLKFLNRSESPSWALVLGARDQMVFLDDRDPLGNPRDSEVKHHVQGTIGISFLFGGERRASIVTPPMTTPTPRAEDPVTRDPEAEARARALAEIREKIFFDFDRSEIKPPYRETLQRKAEALRALADLEIVIEGHADERGTIDYNLALGERRARAAFDYLTDLGIDPSRMSIVSYGEERPAEPGHDEAAWAQNRRAVTVVAATG